MLKQRTLSLLFGLAAQATVASTPAELRGVITSHEWSRGGAACASLPDEESRQTDRWRLPASHYAELAALCAAVESGAGDELAADWWWFTATAMDSKAALGLLPELRSNGLLTRLSSPRKSVTSVAVKETARPHVTLPTGEEIDGERVKVVGQPRPPEWFSTGHYAMRAQVVVEIVIGTDGIARQPLLLSARAQPLLTFLTFAYLRQWRFHPARVAGQPTASAYQIRINIDTIRG